MFTHRSGAVGFQPTERNGCQLQLPGGLLHAHADTELRGNGYKNRIEMQNGKTVIFIYLSSGPFQTAGQEITGKGAHESLFPSQNEELLK